MEKNRKIYDYFSYAKYQNNLYNAQSDRTNLIHSKHYINNYNSFGNFIPNYKMTVNNPLFKENNFFIKTNNNKNSRLINRTSKLTKRKSHCNILILKTNQNNKDLSTMHIKNNKSLNNPSIANLMTNYYSNIFINNNQYNNNRNGKNINKIIVPRLKNSTSKDNFNNNSFISICSCHNNNEINKNTTNINNIGYQNKINDKKNNKKTINKFSSSPYLNQYLTENNEDINENHYYDDKIYYNNHNKYKSNNAINFNENINYNNIKNIENNIGNLIPKKIINYNQTRNQNAQTFLKGNKTTKGTKTKIKINIYPNYQKIKKNDKLLTANENKKIMNESNVFKNNKCSKCDNQKLNYGRHNFDNKKYSFIDNYAFYEVKNTHLKKNYNSYNTNKNNQLINKTEPNINFNNINKNEPIKNFNNEIDDKKVISLAKKNFELFLKKNNKLNLKYINIKKRKRHKSQNQIDKEKNLDRQKALSYRESIPIKPNNSFVKNKINVLANVTKTLSQKKYKEDYNNIINKEKMNNVKSLLFENLKDNSNDIKSIKSKKNINKYNNLNLKRQIGCQFTIFKKGEKRNNDCLNGIITYYNSENLKNKNYYIN